MRTLLAGLLSIMLLPAAVVAGDVLSVDARFDRTGDGIVDASDWELMAAQERMAYARASVEALGEDPDSSLPGGISRAESYLEGLNRVYK